MTEHTPKFDMEEQLKLRLWAGEYYHQGFPIVRLLADMAISAVRNPGFDDPVVS